MAALSLGRTRPPSRKAPPSRTVPLRRSGRTHSALVITVVHNPEDSRIRHRQIDALINAGWQITYAAPFRAFGLDPPAGRHTGPDRRGVRCIDIPRSSGRRRFRAWRAARTILQALAEQHDVVVVHDPELLLAAAGLGIRNLIWDVHEDPAAALGSRRGCRLRCDVQWRLGGAGPSRWWKNITSYCWLNTHISSGSGARIRWSRTRFRCRVPSLLPVLTG